MKHKKLAWKGWAPWSQYRGQFSNHLNRPGLYAILRGRPPKGPVRLPHPRVVYFGETKNLGRRLRELGRAAIEGKKTHAGGMSMREAEFDLDSACVAIRPTNLDKHAKHWIMYEEARLVWRQVVRFGKAPQFNRKGQSLEDAAELLRP